MLKACSGAKPGQAFFYPKPVLRIRELLFGDVINARSP
jgi:hypothetical protein